MHKKNHTIVILHGWGLTGDKYSVLKKCLEERGHQVFSPDFPGFGKEIATRSQMSLSDYTNFLVDYLKKKNIKKLVIIGHSFGGRVGIQYTSSHNENVELLVLTGVPVIRHFGLKQKVSLLAAKTLKIPFIFLPESLSVLPKKILYKIIGEYDYLKSGEKKGTFTNIIRESLIQYFKKITSPIVLVWGELDRLTPVEDMDKISKLNKIEHAKSVPGFGHSLPYQSPEQFAEIVDSYISKYA